ncbi:MlaD family protein [Tepidimonas taiwanensis]|uniref:MlaD protein n=1 Tax=Tepidimonas taiwanensis TaxID=307486 RepID=A0A554X6T4_9BURK|nr:MlaD family protein [Tepidimonas taiwanensis]TSE31527.1 MlaD protein [Tepidimonas taiwanensis]UBQ06231.1 MlaD family protein [Tepidimonas taiwanensis]
MRDDPALPPTGTEPADATPAAPAVERRARALLVLLAALLLGAAGYLLYARGVFESTQTLVLVTDDAEGVTVGMDLTFSGFPIGRVRRIELAPDGAVRIVVDVARRDAHWLREGSVFTMERGIVGGTRLRAYTGVLEGPLLPDGAERRVLRGDALADLPRAVNTARELLEQLRAMTDNDAPLNVSLRELRALLAKANGEAGVLGVVMGSDADRARVTAALDDTRRLLQQATAAAQRVEALVQRADERVLGPQGLADEVQATVQQARELLVGLRGTLQRVDAVLVEAHGIAANTRAATTDLDALRAEVEATLQRVDGMIVDIQRRWPFVRESEVRLP